jgi:hypothetical protein
MVRPKGKNVVNKSESDDPNLAVELEPEPAELTLEN